MKKNGVSFSIVILFIILKIVSACSNQQAPLTLSTNTIPPMPEATNTTHPTASPLVDTSKHFNDDAPPVTISYIKNHTLVDAEIVTIGLNRDCEYASIPVETFTVLKSSVAVDDEANVFFSYGTYSGKNNTIFTKLSCDGGIESINLPISAPTHDTLWIGSRLVFNQGNLLVVDTAFNVEEHPKIDLLPNGETSLGVIGLANDEEYDLIWVPSKPIQQDDKLVVFYRLYNLDTKASTENTYELALSEWGQHFNDTLDEGNILNPFLLYGVDTVSKNVLLCYAKESEEENMKDSFMDLYNLSEQRILREENSPCIKGGTYHSIHGFYASVGCTETWCDEFIRSYSDGSDLIDFSTIEEPGPRSWRWHGSNGGYWILMNPKTLTIMDNEGSFLYEFDMPDINLRTCQAPECVSPGFLISSD